MVLRRGNAGRRCLAERLYQCRPRRFAHSPMSRRSRFVEPRLFFVSSRATRCARGTRVGRRRVGGRITRSIMADSFARQSATLRPCSRCRWLEITRAPSVVSRDRSRASSRSRTSSGRCGQPTASNRSMALLLVRLTCWPPGPAERANCHSRLPAGITIRRPAASTTIFRGRGMQGSPGEKYGRSARDPSPAALGGVLPGFSWVCVACRGS